MQSGSDRILFELKMRGPARIRDLAARIGNTRQAARAHLLKLAIEDSGRARHGARRGWAGRARSGR